MINHLKHWQPISLGAVLAAGISLSAHAHDIGQFASHSDIGPVAHKGQVEFNAAEQSYTVSASGKNMWGKSDELNLAFNELSGDFIVRAQVQFEGDGTDPHRKAGWDVRESLTPDSAHVFAAVHGDGLSSLQFRPSAGDDTDEYRLRVAAPDVIQLERRGDTYIFSAAKFGQPFQVTQVSHLTLADTLYVGLAVCAHNADVTERATFNNVRIIKPADKDFTPYQDYIGSNLEIMDMESFERRIVYRAANSIQAPNWTHDGATLIFNSEGLLHNYDVKSGAVSELNTGFATNNNNDHVLSWDGQQIGISHHAKEEDGRSTLYTLPLTGSDKPTQVTKPGVGHSYLHGFSPDDKSLIFTADRQGQYDIYSVDIATGKETQLTNTKTLDDGSEYSPDGRKIYFNSNRTGTMQLWRMAPDGSAQEQLTFDRYNDWFPHVSPDGKNIVFLSYMDDIDSGDHPFYRHVYLRQMPASGGEPTIIAYLYGGQGSINVPSWSPDGKRIAFISNTKLTQ
jgi:hypothetical protein